MKALFWSDPNSDIEIINATPEAQDEYSHRYGSDTIVLSRQHIDALLAGKMLAWDDGEYSTFVVFSGDDEEGE